MKLGGNKGFLCFWRRMGEEGGWWVNGLILIYGPMWKTE